MSSENLQIGRRLSADSIGIRSSLLLQRLRPNLYDQSWTTAFFWLGWRSAQRFCFASFQWHDKTITNLKRCAFYLQHFSFININKMPGKYKYLHAACPVEWPGIILLGGRGGKQKKKKARTRNKRLLLQNVWQKQQMTSVGTATRTYYFLQTRNNIMLTHQQTSIRQ